MPEVAAKPAEIALARKSAMLAFEAGQLREAEARLTALIDVVELATGSLFTTELYHLYQDRATLLRRANRWEEALVDIAAAERLLPDLPLIMQGFVPAIIAHARAKIYADEFYEGWDAAKARRQLAEVRRTGNLDFAADEMESQLAFRTGDWDRAERCALTAAESLEDQGWLGAAAVCRRRAAEAMIESGDLKGARSTLARAKEHIDRFGTPVDVAHTELAQARLLSARGLHDEAWMAVLESLKQFDILIRSFSSLADQQRFLIDKLDRYADAFRIALAGGGEEGCLRAWSIAERSKSFYLCQLVASAAISLFDGVDPAKLQELRDMESEMDQVDLSISALSGADRESDKGRELTQRLRDLSARKRSRLEDLMRDNPRWGQVTVPSQLDIAAAAGKLPGGWVPISYFWEREQLRDGDASRTLHIFWMDGKSQPRHTSNRWSAEDLGLLHAQRSRLRGRVPWGANLISKKLSDLILPPQVREALPNDGRLLISPHGMLQQVPIHALLVSADDGSDAYLAGMWPIQYLPSLALLPLASHSKPPDRVLLIGCEQDGFGGGPLRDAASEIEVLRNVWSTPGVRRVECRMIPAASSPEAEGVGVDTWKSFGVIHLACHGEFPVGRPFDAGLRLGSVSIRASDLFRTKTNVRMASFSACSIGRQSEATDQHRVAGDEWIGLYLPLLYGGARCVVASLWDAYSEPAGRFMVHLHTAVERGDALVDAVQWAQDRTAREITGSPPATWANWYPVGFPTES